jgi:hypothetical protein
VTVLPAPPPSALMATRKFKPFTPYGTPPRDTLRPRLGLPGRGGSSAGWATRSPTRRRRARRGVEDYGFGVSRRAAFSSRAGWQDIGTRRGQPRFDRSTHDIGTQRGYASADHQRALDMLTRQLRTAQATGQAQQARVMGVAGGGTLVQAARKRAENHGVRPGSRSTRASTVRTRALDVAAGSAARHRAVAARHGAGTVDGGHGGDRPARGQPRSAGSATRGLAGAARRAASRSSSGPTRRARAAQAASTGWDPGPKPKNEFTGGPLGDRRVIRRGNTDYVVDPSGKVLSKHRRV